MVALNQHFVYHITFPLNVFCTFENSSKVIFWIAVVQTNFAVFSAVSSFCNRKKYDEVPQGDPEAGKLATKAQAIEKYGTIIIQTRIILIFLENKGWVLSFSNVSFQFWEF